MTLLVSDSRNASYDGKIATANGCFVAEAYNVGCASTTALGLNAARGINVTFAHAGNCQGVTVALNAIGATAPTYDVNRSITARLQEAKAVGSFNTSTERVNINSHGLANDTPVSFSSTGTLPTGITAGAIYYVINQTTNDFQISTSVGGSVQALSGTPTGTATCWVDRASKILTNAELLDVYTDGTGILARKDSNGFVPFLFATPYAVDTTASKWRFHFFQSGGTLGNWNLLTSDGTNAFYVTWCDTTATPADNDSLMVVSDIAINKTITFAGILGTGETANCNSVFICRDAHLTWESPSTAAYTLTIKGNVYLGTHSHLIFGTEALPNTNANMGDVLFDAPNVGTFANSRICYILGSSSASIPAGKCNVSVWGEIPAVPKTTLASDAAVGQAHLITTDNTGWVNGDQVIIGKQDIVGQGEVSIYTVQSVSGNDITLTSNILTNARLAGATVVKLNGYGFRFRGASHTLYGSIQINNPSIFEFCGVESVDSRIINSPGSYYYSVDNAVLRKKYRIEDCTARVTGATTVGFVSTLGIGIEGASVSRCHAFRQNVINACTGYSNANMKSGYIDHLDNTCLMNTSTVGVAPSVQTKANIQRNKFENSLRYGITLQGLATVFKDNYFWGIASTPASDYSTVIVAQVVNPVEISGNQYEKCGTAIVFSNTPTIGCVDTGSIFGHEVANTIDVKPLAGAILGYVFESPDADIVFDLGYMPDVVPGSKLAVTSMNNVANDDRTIEPEGIIRRTGYGLGDTTVWTGDAFGAASAGQFGMKMTPDANATSALIYSQDKTTGDISGKPMTVSARVKIASANYYAGTHTKPTLRVVYDGVTEVTSVATGTTADQLLQVTFVPATSAGSIQVNIEGATDATGTDADFYVGEITIPLPEGVAVDTTRLGTWVDGLPLPSQATFPSAGNIAQTVREEMDANSTELKKALKLGQFIALK